MLLQIRDFQLSDFNPVIALWKKAGIELSRTDTPEGMKRKLERDPDLFLVVEEDHAIVGAVMGCYDGWRGFVNHLAIDPEYQGRNFGAQLMKELERRFRDKGCPKINLLVLPSNAQVIAFYQKMGYNTDELIFMEKWISEEELP